MVPTARGVCTGPAIHQGDTALAVRGTHALCCLAGSAEARVTQYCWAAARNADSADGPPSGTPQGGQLDGNDGSIMQQLFRILFITSKRTIKVPDCLAVRL